MAPKGKDSGKSSVGGSKGKGKGKDDDASAAGGSGKLKSAQSINVRHILVGLVLLSEHENTHHHCTFYATEFRLDLMFIGSYPVRKALQKRRGPGQIARRCKVR